MLLAAPLFARLFSPPLFPSSSEYVLSCHKSNISSCPPSISAGKEDKKGDCGRRRPVVVWMEEAKRNEGFAAFVMAVDRNTRRAPPHRGCCFVSIRVLPSAMIIFLAPTTMCLLDSEKPTRRRPQRRYPLSHARTHRRDQAERPSRASTPIRFRTSTTSPLSGSIIFVFLFCQFRKECHCLCRVFRALTNPPRRDLFCYHSIF